MIPFYMYDVKKNYYFLLVVLVLFLGESDLELSNFFIVEFNKSISLSFASSAVFCITGVPFSIA